MGFKLPEGRRQGEATACSPVLNSAISDARIVAGESRKHRGNTVAIAPGEPAGSPTREDRKAMRASNLGLWAGAEAVVSLRCWTWAGAFRGREKRRPSTRWRAWRRPVRLRPAASNALAATERPAPLWRPERLLVVARVQTINWHRGRSRPIVPSEKPRERFFRAICSIRCVARSSHVRAYSITCRALAETARV
jgi:hypothetical protein